MRMGKGWIMCSGSKVIKNQHTNRHLIKVVGLLGQKCKTTKMDFLNPNLLLWQNNDWSHSLQLAEIRRVKLSSILCDNSDDIENIQVLILMMVIMMSSCETWNQIRSHSLGRLNKKMLQVYAMVLPDHEINPRVPCKSGVLPRIDLNRWRDASFHSAPSQSFHSGFGKK